MLSEFPLLHVLIFISFIFILPYVYHRWNSSTNALNSRIRRIRDRSSANESGTATSISGIARRPRTSSVFGNAFASLGSMVPRASILRDKIEKAGLHLSVIDFCALCGSLAITATGALKLYSAPWWLAVGVGTVVGLFLPRVVITKMTKRQARLFLAGFPDAIDLMVRSVRSGLPVAEAIHTAGQETNGVVAQTFRAIAGNIKLGLTLDNALWAAARRLELPEFKFFIISLSIQQETGGNLAEILQNLASMMRRREQLRLKIKAMSSEARASAMIIGALPFIMFLLIFMINRDYIMTFFVDPRGWVLLTVGGGSLLIGAFVMTKMVSFEI